VYYTLHFALHDKLAHSHVPLNPRLSIMAALVTVWGARLTFNFARKGGYRWSAEDYRWPYIREKVNSTLAFLVFNLTFIATYQHLLLLSIATPAYLAWQNVGAPLNALDLAAAALCAFFITYETVADQQQWTFQNAKHAKLAAGKRLTGVFAAGFNTSGLFRYSRHPNFWAEQSMWCAFYLFGVAASGECTQQVSQRVMCARMLLKPHWVLLPFWQRPCTHRPFPCHLPPLQAAGSTGPLWRLCSSSCCSRAAPG
jgi:steroid 5-alpha reductase family enzyme